MKKIAPSILAILAVFASPRDASATYGKNCPFQVSPPEAMTDVYVAGGNGVTSTAVAVAISYIHEDNGPTTSWDGLGVNSVSLAYPQPQLGTAWLLGALGRGDNWAGFHPASQYGGLQMRDGNAFHFPIGWAYLDDTVNTAKTNYSSLNYDVVSYECPTFNGSTDVLGMAAITLHEHWHAVLHDHGFAQGTHGHMAGPTGECTNATCDYFYAHHLSDYLPTDSNSQGFLGFLSTTNFTHYFHSPYQIEIEYACDVANFPQGWTPAIVHQNAAAAANSTLTFIANVVPWKCGDPVPF